MRFNSIKKAKLNFEINKNWWQVLEIWKGGFSALQNLVGNLNLKIPKKGGVSTKL